MRPDGRRSRITPRTRAVLTDRNAAQRARIQREASAHVRERRRALDLSHPSRNESMGLNLNI